MNIKDVSFIISLIVNAVLVVIFAFGERIKNQRIKRLKEEVSFRDIDPIKKLYEEKIRLSKNDTSDKAKELSKVNKACLLCMNVISALHEHASLGGNLTNSINKNIEVNKIMEVYEREMQNLLK